MGRFYKYKKWSRSVLKNMPGIDIDSAAKSILSLADSPPAGPLERNQKNGQLSLIMPPLDIIHTGGVK